jgi:regulator of replication initiation timing
MRIEALEAYAASRADDMTRLLAELEAVQAEVPELEAEIVVLRTELTSLRSKLDDEAILARAASEQLQRDHLLLEGAQAALAAVEGARKSS